MNIKRIAALLVALCGVSDVARAGITANAGWASDYYFRGLFQHASSASAGLDYEKSGFYAGTWAGDVGDGLEIDGYAGWAGEFEGIRVSAGITGYFYTGDFDDTYQEVNVSAGYRFASVEAAFGEYDNFDGPTRDYSYYALSVEHNGLYGKYAGFARDFDGDYLELGYGAELEGIDVGIAGIFGDDPATGRSHEALVFSIGKTFQLD